MFRLIETIRWEDGSFNNMSYHEERMYRGMKQIFGVDKKVKLVDWLADWPKPERGLYKCRIVYNNKSHDVQFSQYTMRNVQSLMLVPDDAISYDHKFEDRHEIDANFRKRRRCDDVLIVRRGQITDTSAANIVFRKKDKWITPASYLLPGTMRQSLLDSGAIQEDEVTPEKLRGFESFKIINAMLRFDSIEAPIENIVG